MIFLGFSSSFERCDCSELELCGTRCEWCIDLIETVEHAFVALDFFQVLNGMIFLGFITTFERCDCSDQTGASWYAMRMKHRSHRKCRTCLRDTCQARESDAVWHSRWVYTMVIPIMEFQTLGYKMFNRLLPKVNLQSLSPFLPIFFFKSALF